MLAEIMLPNSGLAMRFAAALLCCPALVTLPTTQCEAATLTRLATLAPGELPSGLIEEPDGSLFGAVYGYADPLNQDYAFVALPPESPGAKRRLIKLENQEGDCYVPGSIGNFVSGPDGIYGTNNTGNGNDWIVRFTPNVVKNKASLGCTIVATFATYPTPGQPFNLHLLGFGPDKTLYAAGYEIINGAQALVLLQLVPNGGFWTMNTSFVFPAGASNDSMQLNANGSISGTVHTVLSGSPEVFTLAPPAAPGGAWTYTPLLGLTVAQDQPVTMDKSGNFYGVQRGSELPGVTDELLEYSPPAAPGGSWSETPIYTTTRHPLVHLSAGPAFLAGGDLSVTDTFGNVAVLTANGSNWSSTMMRLGHRRNFNQGGFAPLVTGVDGNLYGMTYGSPGVLYQVTP